MPRETVVWRSGRKPLRTEVEVHWRIRENWAEDYHFWDAEVFFSEDEAIRAAKKRAKRSPHDEFEVIRVDPHTLTEPKRPRLFEWWR